MKLQLIITTALSLTLALFVMNAQTAAAATTADLTPAQKSAGVISLLMSKKITPQQKVIVCKAVLQGVRNATSNHDIATYIAGVMWSQIYNSTCANVTGAITIAK